MSDQDTNLPAETKGVTLATIHAVKGLEFPVVFLAGMTDGIFPHARALKTPGGIEEEERLAYVGMTRARTKLYLSYARTRLAGENAIDGTPSRFLRVLSRDLIEQVSASVPATIMPAPQAPTEPQDEEIVVATEAQVMNAIPARPEEAEFSTANHALDREVEPETEFERWLGEAQGNWLACEVECADDRMAWVLVESEEEDAEIKAQAPADRVPAPSRELEATLAEAQKAFLEYEMEQAEIAYERKQAAQSRVPTDKGHSSHAAEAEVEDLLVLSHVPATETAKPARGTRPNEQKLPVEISYALAE